jgi:Fic family protein
MKKSLFLYLFILTALFTVFTYMYYSKALQSEQNKYTKTVTFYKKQTDSLKNTITDANYFALETNQNAQDYLEKYDVNKLMPQIKDALLSFNDSKEGNIYTGQEKIDGQKFIINKIKVLNHRWIIADYSNGQLWGEVLIKYFVNEDTTFLFQVEDTYLYPKQQY